MIVERMARDLGLSAIFIASLARSASYEYKAYQIRKRTGGFRTIHHPSKRLKALQRWILANVIEGLPIHQAARAYRKGQSIFDNAGIHAASRYLLRMDLIDFFPSITKLDIARYIAERPTLFSGWTPFRYRHFFQSCLPKLGPDNWRTHLTSTLKRALPRHGRTT